MEIVNGFPCYTCGDAAYAKKHIDPATGREGLVAVEEAAAEKKAEELATVEATNAAISAERNAAKIHPALGANAPFAGGERGTAVNILV